jgi:hypothetical protein
LIVVPYQEVILMIQVVLFQLMYRAPAHDDDNDTIIATMQLVLYQDKYKTIRPFHLSTTAPATATTDTATTTV